MALFSPLWLLAAVLPIAVWVGWSDMKSMKIPNKAVMAMIGVWVLFGWLGHDWRAWTWGFALFAIVLVIGFLLSSLRTLGAGDAKFAAAMAPFFTGGDVTLILIILSGCLIGAVVLHRILRSIPAVRAATPDWASWTHHKFPAGLALAGMVVIYHLAAFWPQG